MVLPLLCREKWTAFGGGRVNNQTNMKVTFIPSDVAAVLGKHPYRSKEEAVFKILSARSEWKPLIASLKQSTGARTEKEIVAAVSEDVKSSLSAAVKTAVQCTNDGDIETTIATFRSQTVQTLLKDALSGKSDVPSEFKEAAARILADKSTPEKESASLQSCRSVDVLTQEIQKRRGTRMEGSVEDTFGGVVERHKKVVLDCDEYCISGFIDGTKDGKIVETKNRKRVWTHPPSYDVIQLRCYMRMGGRVGGILLENFPGNKTRVTEFPWNDDEWNDIHEGLCRVAEEIEHVQSSEVERIARVALAVK